MQRNVIFRTNACLGSVARTVTSEQMVVVTTPLRNLDAVLTNTDASIQVCDEQVWACRRCEISHAAVASIRMIDTAVRQIERVSGSQLNFQRSFATIVARPVRFPADPCFSRVFV